MLQIMSAYCTEMFLYDILHDSLEVQHYGKNTPHVFLLPERRVFHWMKLKFMAKKIQFAHKLFINAAALGRGTWWSQYYLVILSHWVEIMSCRERDLGTVKG